MNCYHKFGLLLASCSALFLYGCNAGEGAADQLDTHEVTGKVTFNNAPVSGATVTFSPVEKGRPAAFGNTNAQGEYTLTTYDAGDGAPAGEYIVTVTKGGGAGGGPSEEEVHEAFEADSATAPEHDTAAAQEPGSILPTRYADTNQSDLRAKVTDGGENVFNLPLKP